jgi:hypothetical protein
MAKVGENAADGGWHVRFEVSEDLSRGGAPTVLNRAGGALAGGGAGDGAGGVATGGTGTEAGGNPETWLARTPPEDHVMGEAESGDPIELLKKELAWATRLLPVLIGSGGTLSPPWSEQPKMWAPRPMPTNMHAASYLPTGHEE